jgi:exosortase
MSAAVSRVLLAIGSIRKTQLMMSFLLAIIAIVIGWAYLPTFVELDRRWTTEPLYSHGYIIPIMALIILWVRRAMFRPAEMEASAWGIPFILLGGAMRLGGDFYYVSAPERFSLLPMLVGISLVLGGRQALRWTWPAIAYLLFMLPLPGRFPEILASSLQSIATLASTNVLQTLGLPAQAEGNVIIMSRVELGVVEACSGIRMLVVFCAISTAAAIVLPRSLPQRILIVLSSIPLALVCNITRIVLTGVLYELVSANAAEFLFHDLAGVFMCLLGAGLLWVELQILSRLFVPVKFDLNDRPESKQNKARRPRLAASSSR